MNSQEMDLIHEAQQGDVRAFENIMKKYERRVLALAFQVVGNIQDAEDVHQETFMKVFNQIKHFRFESDFYTWLYRITVNTAISARRHKKRHAHSSLEHIGEKESGWEWTPVDPAPGPENKAIGQEFREKIVTALGTLSSTQRAVFVLKYFQEFKIKDISRIMGCSEGTVKNTLFRATRKMKNALGDYIQT